MLHWDNEKGSHIFSADKISRIFQCIHELCIFNFISFSLSILDFNATFMQHSCNSFNFNSIIITYYYYNLRFDLIVPKIELNSIPCYDKK